MNKNKEISPLQQVGPQTTQEKIPASIQQFNQYNYYQQQTTTDKPKSRKFNLLSPFKLLIMPFKLLGLIRKAITTGCFFIVLGIILFVLFIVFRPVFLWNPFKDFLNEGLQPYPMEIDMQGFYEAASITASTTRRLEITEEELAALFKQHLTDETDLRTQISPDRVRVMVNVEESDHPLWLVADISKNEADTFSLTNAGFVRFGFPGGINSVIGDRIFSVLDLKKQQVAGNSNTRFFNFLLDHARFTKNVVLKDVELEEGRIILNFESKKPEGF